MKLYLACIGMMATSYSDVIKPRFGKDGERYFSELRSYAEYQYTFSGHTLPVCGNEFFLDSGAFSAWSKGKAITVEEYRDFVIKHNSQIDVCANLDAIALDDSKESLQRSAEETLENQKRLEDAGLTPLPVFHKGEPFSFLEHYVENYDYICLGRLTLDSRAGANQSFFDHVWSEYLTNADGTPRVKVHAFGMTSVPMLCRYPWHSADSSTWLIQSRLGNIFCPRRNKEGELQWGESPYIIPISDQTAAKGVHGQHIDTMSSDITAEIIEYAMKYYDKDFDMLRGFPAERFKVNINYWLDLEEHMQTPTVYKSRQRNLL